MHVLIAGGTGFLGRHLINTLLSHKRQVTVVTRNPNQAAETLPTNVELLHWNQLASSANGQKFQEIDAVINLSGESIGNRRWAGAVKQEIMDSRINSTRTLVKAINNGTLKPKVLLNASAVGYYGPRGDEKITEEEAAGHDFLAQVCRNWENEAYQVQNSFTRVVTLRIGVVLGKEGALARMVLPYRLYLGGPLGKGTQWLSWIHIYDLINMMKFILEHEGVKGPVNGTAPNPATMKECAQLIGQVLHKPAWFPVPEFLLKIALGQMSEMLLHGQRAVPAKILEAGFSFKYPELKTALEDLLL